MPEETAEDALRLVRENGPWVYELFAVLIHSGSALGGHYYAHIKSLGDGGKTELGVDRVRRTAVVYLMSALIGGPAARTNDTSHNAGRETRSGQANDLPKTASLSSGHVE